MPQLHFSVDDATALRIQQQAAARGLSVSRYLAGLVKQTTPDEWPNGYLDSVIGACAGSGLEGPEDLPIDDVDL